MSDFFQALGMFEAATKEYGVVRGIDDATQAIQKIKNEELDLIKQREAQTDIANQLQARLTALGAPASQIATAVGAVTPEKLLTASDYARKFAETGKQEYADLRDEVAKNEGVIKRAQMEPTMQLEQDFALERLRMQDRNAQKGLTMDQQAKWQEKEEQLAIPGYQRKQGIRPLPTEAANLRAGVGKADALIATLEDIKAQIDKTGTAGIPFTDARADLEGTYANALLIAKDVAKLGALAGPDVDIINKALGTPSAFTTKDAAKARVDRAIKEAQRLTQKELSARGYVAEQSAVQFPKKVKKGNAFATVSNPRELEEALKDGWQ